VLPYEDRGGASLDGRRPPAWQAVAGALRRSDLSWPIPPLLPRGDDTDRLTMGSRRPASSSLADTTATSPQARATALAAACARRIPEEPRTRACARPSGEGPGPGGPGSLARVSAELSAGSGRQRRADGDAGSTRHMLVTGRCVLGDTRDTQLNARRGPLLSRGSGVRFLPGAPIFRSREEQAEAPLPAGAMGAGSPGMRGAG